jgi:hypothetical protein
MKFANTLCTTVVLSLLCATSALAECAFPKKPSDPPDGAKATQDEMIAAMKATKQFDADVKNYQACVDAETEAMLNALGDQAKPEDIKRIKSKQALKSNTAYDEAAKVAAAFNEQLHAFKAK